MKNPHGVEPTRYMKREDSDRAIKGNPRFGPIFGYGYDICICDNCNKNGGCTCTCYGNSDSSYECNNSLKQSLFVNTAGPNEKNDFSVVDYEVFSIDYENRDNIYKLCKYSDIIMEYIETKDISEESLNQFDDDIELLNDLDAIHCDDSDIRRKISQLCFKNPSELLPNTQIVNQQYDAKLKEWAGDYKWRLIYRASEHGYTAKSFHEYCNNVKGPTLIVIKSSGGWIFGGYTTQSWRVVHYDEMKSIYNDILL